MNFCLSKFFPVFCQKHISSCFTSPQLGVHGGKGETSFYESEKIKFLRRCGKSLENSRLENSETKLLWLHNLLHERNSPSNLNFEKSYIVKLFLPRIISVKQSFAFNIKTLSREIARTKARNFLKKKQEKSFL